MAKTMYKIQIGAYRQKSNAQKMAAKLKKAGIPATIITAGGLMKVQCGAFSVKANADKRLAEVKKKGFLNAVLITVPGTEKTAPAPVLTAAGRIRIAALAFFDTGNEAQQYGDCTALIQYGADDKTVEHAVLIDTAAGRIEYGRFVPAHTALNFLAEAEQPEPRLLRRLLPKKAV